MGPTGAQGAEFCVDQFANGWLSAVIIVVVAAVAETTMLMGDYFHKRLTLTTRTHLPTYSLTYLLAHSQSHTII